MIEFFATEYFKTAKLHGGKVTRKPDGTTVLPDGSAFSVGTVKTKTAAISPATKAHIEDAFGDYKQVERRRMTPVQFVDRWVNMTDMDEQPVVPLQEQPEARQHMVDLMHDHAGYVAAPQDRHPLIAGLPPRTLPPR